MRIPVGVHPFAAELTDKSRTTEAGVAVGTAVGGTDVAVGTAGAAVGGIGVAVGVTGVGVGGTGVAVGGSGVEVAGTVVGVRVLVAAVVAVGTLVRKALAGAIELLLP